MSTSNTGKLLPPIESTIITNNNQNNNNNNLNQSINTKANRRLSRVSPSEFDKILDTDITKKYQILDENQLGKISNLLQDSSPEKLLLSNSSSSSSSGNTPVRRVSNRYDSDTPRASTSSISATSTGSTRQKRNARTSTSNNTMLKSVVSGNTSDEATSELDSLEDDGEGGVEIAMLGKRSLETPRRSIGTIRASELSTFSRSMASSQTSPDRNSNTNTTARREILTPKLTRTVSGSRRPSQDGLVPLRPPAPSTSVSYSPTPSSRHNQPQASTSFDTVSSYVHVQNGVESVPSSSRTVFNSNSEDQYTSSSKLNQDATTKPSSFSNTMKKTSRFFRKLGVGLSSPPIKNYQSSGYSSDPNLPPPTSSQSTSTSRAPPPVPTIPESFSRTFHSPPHPSTPPRNRKLTSTAAAALQQSNNSSPSQSSTTNSPNKFRSQYPPGHSRRRSLSMSSINSFNANNRERERSGSAIAIGDDGLYRELQKWKSDIDGVLGQIGDGSELRLKEQPSPTFFNSFPRTISNPTATSNTINPNGLRTKRTSSAPTSPVVGLPEFTPLEMSFRNSPQKPKLIRPESLPAILSIIPTPTPRTIDSITPPSTFPIPPALPRKSSLDSSVARLGSAFTSSSSVPSILSPYSVDQIIPTTPPSLRRSSIPSDITIVPFYPTTSSTTTLPLETITESNPNSPEANLKTPTRLDSYPNPNNPNVTPTKSPIPSNSTIKLSSNPALILTGVESDDISTNYDQDTYSPGGTIVLPTSKKSRPSVMDYFPTSTTTTSITASPQSMSDNSPLPSLPLSLGNRKTSDTVFKKNDSNGSTGLGLGIDGVSSNNSNGTNSYSDLSLESRARLFAKRCWEEDETFLESRKLAEWLGLSAPINANTLKYYMDYFDFSKLRLDMAFRRLCEKLYLKAETQQVDRIIEQFSRRFWEDNPNTIYGSQDIVYAVSYSLLLLNTDLHVVNSNTRMKQSQFVKNTLAAIKSQKEEEELNVGGGGEVGRNSLHSTGTIGSASTDSHNIFISEEGSLSRKSLDKLSPRTLVKKQLSNPPPLPISSASATTSMASLSTGSSPSKMKLKSNQTISSSFDSTSRANSSVTSLGVYGSKGWEGEMEATLKKMYDAIKSSPVFQPMTTGSTMSLNEGRSSINLAPNSPYGTWNGMNRSVSRKSTTSSTMSAASSFSATGGGIKRASVRGFNSFLGNSNSNEFNRSNSPTPTSSTSYSDDTRNSHNSSQHRTPTIGFANTLSNSIIREQQEEDYFAQPLDSHSTITEEELTLLGAPWAKEGLLQRKHYWETKGKRAREKNWLQAFVVIAKGEVKMFRFDGSGTVKASGKGKGGMGGGDWASNAQSVGEISLSHALCSAMPPPGYNRSRPYCFVLTLPSGGSYFFQAGTQDLITEWVSTCNYWSARSSKEPLSGGVSNMEYGWNRVVESQLEEGDNEEEDGDSLEAISIMTPSIRSGKSGKSHLSSYSRTGSSLGNSLGPSSSSGFNSSHNQSLPSNLNDRILIQDWTAPSVPNGISTLSEEHQIECLKKYVKILKGELGEHNNLRVPMNKLFSNRSINLAKANANWDRKSQYLVSELLKYETYVEALEVALKFKTAKNSERQVEEMLLLADQQEEEEGLEVDENENENDEEEREGEGENEEKREKGKGVDLFGPVEHLSSRFERVNLIKEEDEDVKEEEEEEGGRLGGKGLLEEERRPSLAESTASFETAVESPELL